MNDGVLVAWVGLWIVVATKIFVILYFIIKQAVKVGCSELVEKMYETFATKQDLKDHVDLYHRGNDQ